MKKYRYYLLRFKYQGAYKTIKYRSVSNRLSAENVEDAKNAVAHIFGDKVASVFTLANMRKGYFTISKF